MAKSLATAFTRNLSDYREITGFLFFYFRCGDRLLAVDGHTLESIPHATAVTMLKQTSTRVVLEVVSWLGTEL